MRCTGLIVAALCALLAVPGAASRADGPPVWSVAGHANTVYLFGSVHLLKPGEFALRGVLEDAYRDAEAVLLEVDLDELSPLEVAATTAARAVDPQGRSLDDLMGEDAALARNRAGRIGIDLSPLGSMEPWFAGLAVVSIVLAREGYTATDGVERVLQARAAADGKEILGLETLDDQLGALDSMDIGIQREFLLKALDDAARPAESLEEFLRAWRSGDDAGLAQELETEFAGEPELYRSLIVDRNRSWASRIEDLLDDGRDYLVVVGALHLVGPDGLPAMLASRGLSVARR
jgi:uncharacterized protein YbaP (TraB family)